MFFNSPSHVRLTIWTVEKLHAAPRTNTSARSKPDPSNSRSYRWQPRRSEEAVVVTQGAAVKESSNRNWIDQDDEMGNIVGQGDGVGRCRYLETCFALLTRRRLVMSTLAFVKYGL